MKVSICKEGDKIANKEAVNQHKNKDHKKIAFREVGTKKMNKRLKKKGKRTDINIKTPCCIQCRSSQRKRTQVGGGKNGRCKKQRGK